jgi:putative N6-adenine-specific DNA methylase
MENFFATCPRGLETLLAEELTSAGATEVQASSGGVGFRGDWAVCYRANLESRLAARVLWLLSRAPYLCEEDIYRQARHLEWERHFEVFRTFRVQTTATRSPLKSLDFVTLRVKDAICDRFRDHCGERPNVGAREPDIRVQVFLTGQDCALYLDTSGTPLWQRGLRRANVDAPLKENLAAGILKLSGWRPGIPLLDPMCGGGTFALEAASMALRRAPGLDRPRFGFETLKNYQRDLWLEIRKAAFAQIRETSFQQIWASDIDERAVRATKKNLHEAGLGGAVKVERKDFLDCRAPLPALAPAAASPATPIADASPSSLSGILIANPPYGERIGELDQLAALYPAMSATLKRHFAGWKACFFTADARLPKLLRLKPERKTQLLNGALECRLYEIRMVAGSNRKFRSAAEPAV